MPKKALPLLKPGQTILFDGDSLTDRRMPPTLDDWPYLRLSNWNHTYAHRVAEWLFCNRPDLNLKFRHAAVGGSSCRNLLERFDRFITPIKPDLVILTLSGNDSAQKIPLPEFKAKVTEYCTRIRELSQGRVMAVSGFLPCPNIPAGSEEKFPVRKPYYACLKQVVKRHGGYYLDLGAELQRKARELYKAAPIHTVYSDGTHYNAVGNEIIAMQVLRGLGMIQF